jgi:hypothetical protein
MSIAAATPEAITPPDPRRILPAVAATLALVALADVLLFAQRFGISLALFLAAVAVGAAVACHPLDRSRVRLGALALGAALLPLLENVSLLSVAFGLFGVAIFVLTVTQSALSGLALAAALPRFMLGAPFRVLLDALWFRRVMPKGKARVLMDVMLGWLVPLALCGMFLLLFGIANPVIEALIARAPLYLLGRMDPARAVFWAMVAALAWGVVAYGIRPREKAIKANLVLPATAQKMPGIYGPAVLLRSLVLFNLLFAVQSSLDFAYLWGGLELPDGMSYAHYAHRGAYPLIVTALLAAGFVLTTMAPGGDERSPRIRALVFLWIGQNILLVISSILRLDLYVEAYSLTYWRVAAFVWMVLVMGGLILIVLRIALGRANRWLIAANLIMLTVTLYGCSFVNIPRMIAAYNIEHASDSGRQTRGLDDCYLRDLGPQAIPAIDRGLADGTLGEHHRQMRSKLAAVHHRQTQNWRAWTFRNWQLRRYLDRTEAPAAMPAP